MIELDGVEYAVEDAGTNAGRIIEYINQYCSDNQIKNTKGELIQFEINWANPLYILLYGVGYLFSFIQNLVYSAGCAVSIANSSERQLLNIADMCNIKRKKATKTSIVGTVYALLSGDENIEYDYTAVDTSTAGTWRWKEAEPTGTENPHAEGWYDEQGGATVTADTNVISGKTYWIKYKSPNAEGWYDSTESDHVSTDTEVDSGKTYYTRTPRPCEITTDLTCTVTTSSGSVSFHPAFDMTIDIGGSKGIVLITEEAGSFSIPENTVTTFDSEPYGFRKMSTFASQPGQEQESIANLRARIQRRSISGSVVDRCKDAISELEGISSCNIYYNNSATEISYVYNHPVAPRRALLFIQGYNENVATTYWSYMSSECAGDDWDTAITQNYTTHSGQQLPVYLIPPTQKTLRARIYCDNAITETQAQEMRDVILELSSTLTIGESISSGSVLKKLQERFTSYTFTGCQLSWDVALTNWTYKLDPEPYELAVFNNSLIQVIGASND